MDFSRVEFLTYDEGLCVQCMHNGSYDDEPATVELMHNYMKENGYKIKNKEKIIKEISSINNRRH